VSGIVATLLAKEDRATLRNPPKWLYDALAGSKSSAGVRVTEKSALNLSTVWAAVLIISQTVASLPLIVYRRRQPRGKTRVPEHPLFRLLHDQPNEEMTSMVFRETLEAHALTWGNGYAQIQRDGNTRPMALWPLSPEKTKALRNDAGDIVYELSLPSGETEILPSRDVFHLPGLGFDGRVGYSVVRMARETMGLTKATETFGATFFANGSQVSGVLEYPGKINDEGKIALRKAWERLHKGAENAHRVAVLEDGMKWNQIGIPPDDAQFLETRRFQVEEIARWFNVPPHKIGHLDKATFNNIEQENIHFVVDTVRPWLVRWEQEIKRKLTMPSETDLFAEHLVDGLLRGDQKTRYEAYTKGRNWGWLSANDVRELENMNPLDGDEGESYIVPLNMTPADALGSTPAPDASLAQMLEGQQPLLASTLRSVLRTEADKLQRAAKREPDFEAWLEQFYGEHKEHVRAAVAPIFDALRATLRSLGLSHKLDGLQELDAELAQRHVDESMLQVYAALRCAETQELRETVARCVKHWPERADETAAQEIERLAKGLDSDQIAI